MLHHECLGYGCEWWCHYRPALSIQSLTVGFLQVVALSGGVGMRLLGISIASFSSGPFDHAVYFFRLWLKITPWLRSRWAHLLAAIHHLPSGRCGAQRWVRVPREPTVRSA
jgi:hypothetical protein